MERVVITGLGILAANGTGKEAFWDSLTKGRSGIGLVSLFDASGLSCQIAGEVKDFDPNQYALSPPKVHREARNTQLALAAASLAREDAGFARPHAHSRNPILVAMGVSTSSFDIIHESITRAMKLGPNRVGPQIITSSGIQMPANTIAKQLGHPAETQTIASACAAGQDAIAYAAQQVRSGRFDIAVAGGSDAPISLTPFADFCACPKMLSKRNDDPEHASRPFDRERDGGVIAEGAAVLVLENLHHALGRGATIYSEIVGSATRLDDHATLHESGLAHSMRMAIANACCLPGDIDYVCAHGPSDPELDRIETNLIKEVFADHAYRMPVSSIKGVTGNPLSAAGAMQVLTASMALQRQVIPMTANFEFADPLCDLDYVVEESRHQRLRTVLVNNHGISGGNSSLVLRAYTT